MGSPTPSASPARLPRMPRDHLAGRLLFRQVFPAGFRRDAHAGLNGPQGQVGPVLAS